jgi:hypothetical protein
LLSRDYERITEAPVVVDTRNALKHGRSNVLRQGAPTSAESLAVTI